MPRRPPPPTAPGRRERTKARNRAALLRAARQVFGRVGFDAASVRDVVRASGLSVGTFYQYFRGKEQVFAAVAEEAVSELRARLRAERRDRRHGFEERLRRAYRAFFDFAAEERALFDLLERNVWSLPADADARARRLAIDELREDIAPDLARAGVPAQEADAVAAAMIGTGLMVARRGLERGRPEPEAAARFCTRMALEGLRGLAPHALERRSA